MGVLNADRTGNVLVGAVNVNIHTLVHAAKMTRDVFGRPSTHAARVQLAIAIGLRTSGAFLDATVQAVYQAIAHKAGST